MKLRWVSNENEWHLQARISAGGKVKGEACMRWVQPVFHGH